jgi:cobalt-zinc-cadmium efflux system outer membrane protein
MISVWGAVIPSALAQTPPAGTAPPASPAPAVPVAPAIPPPTPAPEAGPSFGLRGDTDLDRLEALVRARAANIQQDRLNNLQAESDYRQSLLWDNPSFDFTWGAIPAGETNESAPVKDPLLNVPNYNFGLSYRFEIYKRGPRQKGNRERVLSSRLDVDASVRRSALDLASTLGKVASAVLRAEAGRLLRDDAKNQLDLSSQRLKRGFVSELEVDRLKLEVARLEQQEQAELASIASNLASCAGTLGVSCRGFGGADDARAFMLAWIARARGQVNMHGDVAQRPDIRSLSHQARAARFDAELARNTKYPDPTVRLGYVRDQYFASGNYQNTLSLGVSFPIPVFDTGKVKSQAFARKAEILERQRELTVQSALARLASLHTTLAALSERHAILSRERLPRGRAILKDLQKALASGLIPLSDVIEARRSVNELLLAEAESLSDAFDAAVSVFSMLPGRREPAASAPGSVAPGPAPTPPPAP